MSSTDDEVHNPSALVSHASEDKLDFGFSDRDIVATTTTGAIQ